MYLVVQPLRQVSRALSAPYSLPYFHASFLPSLLTYLLTYLLLSNLFVGELSFCFIYKFRQRFGVVANTKALAYNHSPSSNPSNLTLTLTLP